MKMTRITFFIFLFSFSVDYVNGQAPEYDSITKLPPFKKNIEKKYTVLTSHLSLMESIDWGEGNFLCYDMTLKSSELPTFIEISVILRHFLYPGIKPLTRKLDRIHKIIGKSYPYKFATLNQDVLLEIHFVNRRSFSRSAKKSLKEDMKNSNKKIKIRHLRKCVLLFSEHKDAWHGWIIQENGDAFLWYYKGQTVLGIDPKDLPVDTSNSYRYSFKTFNTQGEALTK